MLEFWLPLLLLFIAATVTAIVSRRKQDRCLRFFRHKPVIVMLDSGKKIWGKLTPYPQQMELLFAPSEIGSEEKASYVLYEPEINSINRIVQPQPPKESEAYRKWEKEVARVASPSLFKRLRRWSWNIMNTLRDAVSQSIGMILGTLKSKTAMGKVIGADKRAGEISNTLLGTVPNAYEPILEKYLSKRVVVEMVEEGEVIEYVGLLQEYSEKFLLLRNVSYTVDTDTGTVQPDHSDLIFPRKKTLVRHCLRK